MNPFDHGCYNEEELQQMGFASVGSNVRIDKSCVIYGLENIEIGSNVRIDAHCSIVAGSAGIRLGNYIHIGGGCHLAGRSGITMEDFSGLSQGVKIYSVTDDYSGGCFTNPTLPEERLRLITGSVKLEKHVIVGSGSVILPNVTLAEGCAVGALALVKNSSNPWKILVGQPAKEIADREKIDPTGEVENQLLN